MSRKSPKPARSRPTRQQIAAAATREEILKAARRLFGERGYSQTAISDIAEEAGVSVPTIYASVGQKQAIVIALIGFVDQSIGGAEARQKILTEEDPMVLLRTGARVMRSLDENFGDILRTLRSAAESEPAVAEARLRARGFHKGASQRIAERLETLGALRTGVSRDAAAGLIWLLTDSESFDRLKREMGWTYDQAETWLVEALAQAVLAPIRSTGSRARGGSR